MLSVSIHKDIGEYSEKVVGKLSFRTLLCVIGGLVSAIVAAAFTYLVLGIDVSNATLPVMVCSMPFWLAGFWRPVGMKLEKFLPLWFQHTFSEEKIYCSSSLSLISPSLTAPLKEKADRKSRRRARRKGAELYEYQPQD